MPKKGSRPGRTGVYIEFPNELLAALDAKAAQERRTRTTVVLMLIEKYVGIEAAPKKRGGNK